MQDDLQEEFGLFDFPDQDSAKCVIKCIMNRMGLFNDKRGPHVGRLVRQMKFASVSSTKEIRGEILNCAYQDMEMDPEDVCERAYALYQCIQNSNLLLMKSPGSINTWKMPPLNGVPRNDFKPKICAIDGESIQFP